MLPELIEASYLSRFFAKFTEIIAAGLATAMCAYLISYLGVGGPPPHVMPAPAAVSVAPTVAGEVAVSLPAQPAPPVTAPPQAAPSLAAAAAASAVDEQRRVPQPVTDAPPAQPARKAEKAAMAVPAAPKDIKTGTSVARGEKSAEALARAALANVDADRPAPADTPAPNHRRVSTGTGSAGSGAVEVPPRPADVPLRQADVPPPPALFEAPPRRVAVIGPPPSTGSPPEIAAPQPEPRADQHKGLFSFIKRGTPSFAGEAPRPPMPVGTDE
jgi:hypothetical protein